jgi:hypothetical protein
MFTLDLCAGFTARKSRWRLAVYDMLVTDHVSFCFGLIWQSFSLAAGLSMKRDWFNPEAAESQKHGAEAFDWTKVQGRKTNQDESAAVQGFRCRIVEAGRHSPCFWSIVIASGRATEEVRRRHAGTYGGAGGEGLVWGKLRGTCSGGRAASRLEKHLSSARGYLARLHNAKVCDAALYRCRLPAHPQRRWWWLSSYSYPIKEFRTTEQRRLI